jgi:hypothetical protein
MPLKSCPAHTLQPLSFKPTVRNKRTFRLANNKSFYITLFKNHVMALKGETKKSVNCPDGLFHHISQVYKD